MLAQASSDPLEQITKNLWAYQKKQSQSLGTCLQQPHGAD